jgi:hypothetical protein
MLKYKSISLFGIVLNKNYICKKKLMLETIVKDWLKETQTALIENYDRLGLRASGAWAESVESNYSVTASRVNAIIQANKYAYWLEHGRGETAPEKRGKLGGIILQWIEDKGITPEEGTTKESLAFLIARKIDNEGIKVPNKYNKGGLVSDIITDARINKLSQGVLGVAAAFISSNILKALKDNENANIRYIEKTS